MLWRPRDCGSGPFALLMREDGISLSSFVKAMFRIGRHTFQQLCSLDAAMPCSRSYMLTPEGNCITPGAYVSVMTNRPVDHWAHTIQTGSTHL